MTAKKRSTFRLADQRRILCNTDQTVPILRFSSRHPDDRRPGATVRKVAASGDSIEDIQRNLSDVWPTMLADVILPVEEDATGAFHDIRREVRCAAPTRIAESSVAGLLEGERCCPACIPLSLAPGGRLFTELDKYTLCLRTALDRAVTASERAAAAVLTVWDGTSRYLPPHVFERLRGTVLLPLVTDLATGLRQGTGDESGPLVAFTAGDMRLGRTENPQLYAAIARSAAVSLVHASPRDGVWLLHDPFRHVTATVAAWPPLGRVLVGNVARSDLDPVACEIFGVLADDALAGASSWDDIHEWWAAARRLNS